MHKYTNNESISTDFDRITANKQTERSNYLLERF